VLILDHFGECRHSQDGEDKENLRYSSQFSSCLSKCPWTLGLGDRIMLSDWTLYVPQLSYPSPW
jgi:hypothetical protein